MTPSLSPLLTAALSYAARGWRIFPLHHLKDGACTCAAGARCDSVGKHPRTENGLLDATTDPAQLRRWWKAWPLANIGLVCGAESGLVAIDIDPRHDGDNQLADLLHEHGRFPDTVEALTGGGGTHYLFRHPGVRIRTRGKLLGCSGIDVRGDGGYIVAPPSLHHSGRTYEWELSSHPDDVPLADMPAWLLAATRADQPAPAARIAGNGTLAALAPQLEGCAWLRHCRDEAAALGYGEWFALSTILGHTENGREVFHEWSAPHATYDAYRTDKQFDATLKSGPHTCASIRAIGGASYCATCVHSGKIVSPITLAGWVSQITVPPPNGSRPEFVADYVPEQKSPVRRPAAIAAAVEPDPELPPDFFGLDDDDTPSETAGEYAAFLETLRANPDARTVFQFIPLLTRLSVKDFATAKVELKEILGARLNLNDLQEAIREERKQHRVFLPRGRKRQPRPDEEEPVHFEQFRCYMPEHRFIFLPNGDLWPASSVDARLPRQFTGKFRENGEPKSESASEWLAREQPVEQMTWAPGLPRLIEGQLLRQSGWFPHPGAFVYNQYHPPTVGSGDPDDIGPWWGHLVTLYGEDDAAHIVKWAAHRVQRPQEKLNHALVLGGDQGIGKDTILEPIRHAVGTWNFRDVSPTVLLGRFNAFIKSVILRVSEARDLGDVNRYAFYEHCKTLIAAPPDMLTCDEKNVKAYDIPNLCGVILTTNHRTGGLYLPADDRRHFVAWSDRTKADFAPEHWPTMWEWFDRGGRENVAAYLRCCDLKDFNPKAPPRQTDAFWTMVDAGAPVEDMELLSVLEALDKPPAVTRELLLNHPLTPLGFREWMQNRQNQRGIPKRFEACGYIPFRNPSNQEGRWKIHNQNRVIYVRRELDYSARLEAALALARTP